MDPAAAAALRQQWLAQQAAREQLLAQQQQEQALFQQQIAMQQQALGQSEDGDEEDEGEEEEEEEEAEDAGLGARGRRLAAVGQATTLASCGFRSRCLLAGLLTIPLPASMSCAGPARSIAVDGPRRPR